MRVNCYLSGNPVHDRVVRAFYDGCASPDKHLRNDDDYAESEVAVIFGMYKRLVPVSINRGKIFRKQREQEFKVVVLETGYINRGDGEEHHYAAGLNGLNGRATFRNHGMDASRLDLLRHDYGLTVYPWRETGEHVLLCGQVPWDASVEHVDHVAWLSDAVAELKTRTTRPIRFRPHPFAPIPAIKGCQYSKATIAEDFARAHACVTYNSNSAVEAIIAGVPAFAFDDGSMALPVASRRWAKIEAPKTPEREQWLCDLAYTQWTPAEMREGRAWTHLFRP